MVTLPIVVKPRFLRSPQAENQKGLFLSEDNGESWQRVDVGGQHVTLFATGDAAIRPAHQQRHTMPPIIRRALAPAHAAIVAHSWRAIVGEKNQDRVLLQT